MGEFHERISHDSVNRWMRKSRFTSKMLWEHASDKIVQTGEGYLIFDDTVLD